MGWIRRAGMAAALLGSMLVAAAPVPALAAVPAAHLIDVQIGSPDVIGSTGAQGDVVTIIQKRAGKRVARRQDTTDSLGWFEVRLAPIRGGDQLVLQFKGTRVVTVPRLALAGNPVTDRVTGRTPAPNDFVNIGIGHAIGGYLLGADIRTVATDAAGRFSATFDGLSGAERLELTWQNAVEDQFRIVTTMTAAEVEAGKSGVQAFGPSGRTMRVELRAPNGNLRGTAVVRIQPGLTSGRGTFRKHGARVKVHAGDRVRIGSLTGLVVITMPLTLGPTGANSTCFPDRDWIIGTVFGAGAFSALDQGTADGAGTVTASWPGTLSSGTVVRLMCENGRGWVQDVTGFVF